MQGYIKYKYVSFAFLALVFSATYLPFGSTKLYIAISLLTYIIANSLSHVCIARKYTVLSFVIVSLLVFSFINTGNMNYTKLHLGLVYLAPYLGAKLYSLTYGGYKKFLSREISHIYVLSFAYISILSRGILISKLFNAWTFHSASLALIGAILALELLKLNQHKKHLLLQLCAYTLLIIPIFGVLRQYLYYLPLFIFYIIRNKLSGFSAAYAISCFGLVLLISPGTYDSIVSSTVHKTGGLANYFSGAGDVNDSSLNTRQVYWQHAIVSTVRKNIVLGNVLEYRFTAYANRGDFSLQGSHLLHSYFVSAFADGGLLLLSILAYILFSNLISSIRARDGVSIIVFYSYIIVLGVNPNGLNGYNAYVLFFIYAYYEFRLFQIKPTQKRSLCSHDAN